MTRRVEFSASQRYFRPDWSEERNREIFGKCANAPGHGHNYRCLVTLAGQLADDTQMVMDLATLDRILDEEIVQRLDHQHLNQAVDDFVDGTSQPTAEALAVHLWKRIGPRLPVGVTLHRIRIQEDVDLHADYYGK